MSDRHTLAVTAIVAVSKWRAAQPWMTRPKRVMPFINQAYWYAIQTEEN